MADRDLRADWHCKLGFFEPGCGGEESADDDHEQIGVGEDRFERSLVEPVGVHRHFVGVTFG